MRGLLPDSESHDRGERASRQKGRCRDVDKEYEEAVSWQWELRVEQLQDWISRVV